MKTPITDMPKESMENLVYLFLLVFPGSSARAIYNTWKTNPILGEYARPEFDQLEGWCKGNMGKK